MSVGRLKLDRSLKVMSCHSLEGAHFWNMKFNNSKYANTAYYETKVTRFTSEFMPTMSSMQQPRILIHARLVRYGRTELSGLNIKNEVKVHARQMRT